MKLHILSLVGLCFFSLNLQAQTPLTLEEAVSGQFSKFAPERIDQLQWEKGTSRFTYVKENALWVEEPKAKMAPQKLVELEQLNAWKGGNPWKAFPGVSWQSKDVFLVEANNAFWQVDLQKQKVNQLCSYDPSGENQDFHYATKRLAYTVDNDLFVQQGETITAVTHNEKNIVSGQSISRNEYGIEKGIFWSPDGSKLAFYQKDESRVSDYPLVNYTMVPAEVRTIKYPFAGRPSEYVSIGVYDVSQNKTVFMRPKMSEADQFYLTNLAWSPDNSYLYVAWLNRQTTQMRLIVFDAKTGEELKTLFEERDEKWVEPLTPVLFVPTKNNQFVWLSRRDGFMNVYHYNTDGKLLGNTKFQFDVTGIVKFDSRGEFLFVTATGENPTNQMCYRIQMKNMATNLVTPISGVHQVKVSDNGQWVLDKYSNLTTAAVYQLATAQGKSVRNLLISKNPFEGKSIGSTELFTIKAEDGSDLWCRLIKPSQFDPNKKYPVLVYLYNGPHVQLVTNSFLGGSSLWMNYMAEKGYLVFTLDGHGSANRGRVFEQVIHRQLGTQEIQDQLLGVEWLKKQSFVDSERMAIHGWSYGGFMTTNMMLRTPGVFKVGVAGGPVIDWALYEVMYGERYMDTPQENPEGYQLADLTQHVKKLQGDLLMIHGVDDDVVVMQHNMKFLKACVDQGVQVDFFAYPGHAHNVRGKDRVHLMTKVLDYIEEKLAK